MPVDVSSYGLLNQTANPLDMAGKLTALQGQTNQNRLFQQEYNSKLGLSQIYKQAIDPATGQLDTNKLNALMSGPNSGNISLGLPQAYQNSQEAQKRNLDINSQQLKLAQDNVNTLLGYIGPLAANPKATRNDVLGAASKAITLGHANPQTVAQALADLPDNDAEVPGWVLQRNLQALGMLERFNALNPTPTMQDLPGGGKAPFVMPQVGQVQQVGPSIQAAPPPTTQVFDQSGQARFIGNPQGNNPYEPSGAPAQATPQASVGGGSGAPAAAAAPRGIGGQLAAAPPGVAEAATTTANANAQSGLALQGRAGRVNDNKALLGSLESNLAKFTSGPGSDWKKVAGAFLNSNSPFGNLFDPSKIASQEEFNKQAGLLAQSQFQALGGTGTDSKLDAATLTSPNSELSKFGNKGIIAMLKGNEDAIAVKNSMWQDYLERGNSPATYGKFERDFNKAYDPRVFQTQYLPPEDNKKMIASMSKDEQKKFIANYRTALQNGWVKLPGAQ